MNYWKTFTTTFKQWWHHKYLWLVGLIGSIFAGGGASSSGSSGGSYSPSSTTSSKLNSNINLDFLKDPNTVRIIVIVFVVIVILSLIFLVISLYMTSRANSALIQATDKINQDDSKLGFKQTWSLGKFRLGTLVKYQLLVGLPMYILGMMVIVGAFVLFITGRLDFTTVSLALVSFILFAMVFLCVFVLYTLVVAVISVFGIRISVLENVGLREGFSKGYILIKSNLGQVIVFWLLTFIISGAVGIISLPVTLVLIIGGIGVVIPLIIASPVVGIIVAVLIVMALIIIMVLLEGPVYAFTQMYWTNVYLELKKK